MPFISLRPEEVDAMLRELGLTALDELFDHIPAALRHDEFDLPPGQSQLEVEKALHGLARLNSHTDAMLCFLGGGAYDHYVPPVVREILRRGEFYTSYTPYQPEIAQGVLQALFEYQTIIARLTGLQIANASLYDGASAAWEAILLAVRHTGRDQVVLDANLHPNWREVIATGASGIGLNIVEVASGGLDRGRDVGPLAEAVGEKTAAVLVPNPDFMGRVAALEGLTTTARDRGALSIVAAAPLSLQLFTSPGEAGADVACGEAQELGLALNGGGPYLGYLACRKELVRRVPGRLVGMTVDSRGDRAFTLTLQTREQHIRRDKATSNICTNQSLCALAAGLFLAAMGSEGLRRCAEACLKGADRLRRKLASVANVTVFPGTHWREFVYRTTVPAERLCEAMVRRGILAGIPLKAFMGRKQGEVFKDLAGGAAEWDAGDVLVAVTEKRSEEDLDRYVAAVRDIVET